LRDKCSAEDFDELGDKIRQVKSIAPTHPQPSAPDTPVANVIVGPMAGLVDRVRDVLTGNRTECSSRGSRDDHNGNHAR